MSGRDWAVERLIASQTVAQWREELAAEIPEPKSVQP